MKEGQSAMLETCCRLTLTVNLGTVFETEHVRTISAATLAIDFIGHCKRCISLEAC